VRRWNKVNWTPVIWDCHINVKVFCKSVPRPNWRRSHTQTKLDCPSVQHARQSVETVVVTGRRQLDGDRVAVSGEQQVWRHVVGVVDVFETGCLVHPLRDPVTAAAAVAAIDNRNVYREWTPANFVFAPDRPHQSDVTQRLLDVVYAL